MTTNQSVPDADRFWTWLCIAAIFSNFLLDTMIAPALPAIGEALALSESQLGFVLTCGLLTSAIALPLGGRIADIHDRRFVLTAILLLGLSGSALAALATSFAMAALGQALLGTVSVLLPVGVALAAGRPGSETSTAMVFVSSGVSALTGLLIGGYVLDHYPYHALFWIVCGLNALLLAAALIALVLTRRQAAPKRAGGTVDFSGGLMLGAALGLGLYGLSLIGREEWLSPALLLPLVLALLFGTAWWRLARRNPSPLIDPRQLLDPVVARFSLIQLASGFNATALLVAIPMIVTSAVADGGLGQSESVSSYLFIPSSIVLFMAPMATLPLRRLIGERGVVIAATLLIAVGSAVMIIDHGVPAILAGTVLGSVGLGLLLTQTFDLLAVWIEPDRVASVTGFILVLKILGAALGGQFAANLMELLPPATGFQATIIVSTVVMILSLPASLGLGRQPRSAA